MTQQLAHDAAFLLAQQLIALIRHLLREEEVKDAFAEIYHLARAAVERFAAAEERRRSRKRHGLHGQPRTPSPKQNKLNRG